MISKLRLIKTKADVWDVLSVKEKNVNCLLKSILILICVKDWKVSLVKASGWHCTGMPPVFSASVTWHLAPRASAEALNFWGRGHLLSWGSGREDLFFSCFLGPGHCDRS